MAKKTKKKFQYGDVFQIPVDDRYAYCQYAHSDPTPGGLNLGNLVYILPGVFDAPLKELESHIAQESQFCTFVVLGYETEWKRFKYVGNYPTPESRSKFPLFKSGTRGVDAKTINVWWVWDGETSSPVGQLKKSQYTLPLKVLSNQICIVDQIKCGYRPEDDVAECSAGQPLPEKLKERFRDRILKLAPYLIDEE